MVRANPYAYYHNSYRFMSTTESVTHSFSLVNGYKEPSSIYPPTHTLELTLSTPHVDLLSIHLSILPQLKGIVYYMYYYPISSLVVGVGMLWGLQMGVLTGFILVRVCLYM
ncbi:hypothetical protein EON63_22380 [archaeon]|nr:MAG: hypothetical protein EON63_22380 [archaeon]